MQQRRLGRTGQMVSAIGFGGIKLPAVEQEQATAAIHRALALGVNLIDTARGYGKGDSERKIGVALEGRREEVFLCSKGHALTADEMRHDVEESLRTLRTDYIDLYKCHSLRRAEAKEQVMGPGGALEGLRKCQAEGLVRYVGFSSHRYRETMRDCILSGEFDVIMVAYNVLNDELVDEDVLPLAQEHDVGVLVMKPLAGGALVSPPEEVAQKLGQAGSDSMAVDALRFVLANPAVTCAPVGMTSVQEVEENVRAGDEQTALAGSDLQRIREAAEALGKDFCRACGYCLPCPSDIKIPTVLRHLGYFKRYGLEDWARGRYRMVEVKADECTECGECKEKCPYELDVPELLKEAHASLSPVAGS